jgi:DNA-binding SARP family transcriptional activator
MAVPGILNEPDAITEQIPALTINILGLLEVSIDRHAVRLRPMHALLLLALLFTEGHTLPADRVQRLLFDREPNARTADLLRTYVHQTRKAISRANASIAVSRLLETVPAGGRTLYRLHIQAGHVDAFQLEALEAAGRTALRDGRYAQAIGHLGQATALWRGDALPDVRERPFIHDRIGRYAALRRDAVIGELQARICLNRCHEVTGPLRQLTENHTADSWLWCLYVIGLDLDGRFTDAALTCKMAIETIAETTGLDDNRLRVLQHMVLNRTLPRDGAHAVNAIRSIRS